MYVCRCWGHRFDEDLSLASLRVLPAFSVVPRWREALAVGCPLESLSSTWLGAPPDGKEVGSERASERQRVDGGGMSPPTAFGRG